MSEYVWQTESGDIEDNGSWGNPPGVFGVPGPANAGTIGDATQYQPVYVYGSGIVGFLLIDGNVDANFQIGTFQVDGVSPTEAGDSGVPFAFSAFEVTQGATAAFNGSTLIALSEVMVGAPSAGAPMGAASGDGTLSFTNNAGGTFTATNSATALDVAYDTGVNGTVLVDNSTLLLQGGAYIGVFGNGTLDISNSGVVQLVPTRASYDDFEVGVVAGATGTLSVSYGTLDIGEFTIIGDAGHGIISFTEGAVGSFSGTYYDSTSGSFAASYALYLGGHGGSGTLVVDGSVNTGTDPTQAKSTVTTDAGIVVGQYGNGLVDLTNYGTLAIDGTPGAAFADSEIGLATGATGTIIVTNFASLSASEYVVIGDSGTGTVSFSDGASGSFNSQSALAVYLGGRGGSGSLTIQDSDTTVDMDAGIYVGQYGTGDLTLTGGATLAINPPVPGSVNSFSEVGANSGSTGLVTVSQNAQLTGTGELLVGDAGTGTLDITTGGSVYLNAAPGSLDGAFGEIAGGVGIGLIDDGLLDSAQSFSVGYQGSGTLTVQDHGVLEVDNGNLRVARDPGSFGLLTVDGGDIYAQGAALTVGPNATTSGDGTGGVGTLEIEAGSVYVGSAQVAGLAGGTGSIDVTGGAGLNITGTDFTTGAGTSIITAEAAGGIGVAGAITIGGGGGSALVQITDGAGLYDYGSGITLGALGTLALDDSAYLQAATLTLAGGTLDLLGSRAFDGPLIIAGNTSAPSAIIGAAGADLTLSAGISFAAGTQGVLLAGPAFDTSTEIRGFAAGDTIDLAGSIYNTASYDVATQQLILSNTVDPLALHIADNGYGADSFSAYTDGQGGTDVSLGPPPCYLAGTRIATPDGERRVEDLRPGDRVTLAGGGDAPLIWIGERRLDPTAHPRAWEVLPIRIRSDALAAGLPRRDLLVSPDHALLLDGVLVEAKRLVNGRTIVQEAGVRSVHYLHLELARHDILLAEGVAAESYLDTGNRRAFANADATLLHPSFAAPRAAACCAPFATDPELVRPIWQRLAERAARIGQPAAARPATADPAARLRINGRLIAPLHAGQGRLCFALPPGARRLRLVSRASPPAWCQPWLDDRRTLGLDVARIRLRGQGAVTDLALDGPHLAEGWWDIERDGNATHRWTNGDAAITLPFAADTLELTARPLEAYRLSEPAMKAVS